MKKILLIIGLLFTVNGCMNSSSSMGQSKVGSFLSDTALTAKVKTAMVDQRGLDGLDIKVNTYKGVVQLSGFVSTDVEKELAGQIARNVDGVVEVVNNLIVKP